MKLSIIVPVYNMAADNKLRFCLDSLVQQTIADYEIIAVDDASTDESLEILREYESNYPWKFKVVQSFENLKQGGARNKGLEIARGRWVGFVDSDDWVAPDMYEKLIKKAEKTGADVVGCDYCMVDTHTMTVGKLMPNNTIDQTGVLGHEQYKKLVMNPGSMVIKVYQKAVIDTYALRFPERTFYEDNCASPIWMLHFTHFEKVEEPLYYYYQHDLSTVHAISQEKCEARLLMGKKLIEEARRCGIYKSYRQEFEFAFSKLYYMNTLFTYMLGVRKPKVKFLKKLAEGIKQEFPDFQDNIYYQNTFDEEQKRLAAMHLESSLKFKIYFQLLTFYRNRLRRSPKSGEE
ncbi:MAG: glycosyltransferase [Lachnospiraceae bacterium]|nr:glycosyltransferase [Lachnospiraceae bacterium]